MRKEVGSCAVALRAPWARQLLTWCVAIVAAWQAAAQPALTFRFDQQPILDPPLQFVFNRFAPSIAEDGSVVPANQPRYRGVRLLSPVPQVTLVPGTNGEAAANILATGVAADGVTPVWVVAEYSKVKLEIYLGALPSTPYVYSMSYNGLKGNLMDAMAQSVDNLPGEAWRPVAGAVCHGFIVLQCNVAVPGAAGWNSSRIGFMTCNLADLSGPQNRWWRRHAISDALSPLPKDVGLGSFWSLQNWWSTQRDGTPPTKAWIAATDYHSAPNKDGGTSFVFPIQRSSATSGDWTASAVVELPGRWNDPTNRSHAHSIGLSKYGEHGMIALGSRGDSVGNAAVYTWTIDDEAQYAAGAIPRAGGYNWFQAGGVWTGPTVRNGILDPLLVNPQTRAKGNQFIGLAPGPTEGTFLAGSDEVTDSLWLTSNLLTPGADLTFTTPYRISQTLPLLGAGNDGPWRHYLCFHLRTSAPNALHGAYIGQLAPSQNDMDGWNNQRVIYSPDGEHWSQVWSHFEGTQVPVWLADGRIWAGSYGKHSGNGVRSIPVPDLVSARPLAISPGGRNAATASPSVSDTGLGVSVAVNPALPSGITPPPCTGPWYRVQNAPPSLGAGSFALGRYRLATGVPAGTKEVSIKLWVRQDLPSEGGIPSSLILMAKLRSSNAAGSPPSVRSSINSSSIDISAQGQWMPVVLTTDLTTWANMGSWDAQGGVLDLVLSNAWDMAGPASFYFAVESVSWGMSPPYPGTVETLLPQERGEISGFSVPGNWTVFMAGMVPQASWDNSWAGTDPVERPLFSILSESGLSWIDVIAGRSQSSIILRPGGAAEGPSDEIMSYNWWPGSPAYFAVTFCSEWNGFILHGNVGNSKLKSTYAVHATLDSPAAAIILGSGDGVRVTDFDWFGGAIVPGEATKADAEGVFGSLPMLRGLPMPAMTGDCTDMAVGPCTADFDQSGFIDTDDFDAFVHAFEDGVQEADFDQSGFVDTDDFDAFVIAFMAGC